MPIAFTQLAFDSLQRANENPLNPAVWTEESGDPLAIISNTCQVPSLGANGIEKYTGIIWPNDQWAQIQVTNYGAMGSLSFPIFGVALRLTSNGLFTSGYWLYLASNGDGTMDVSVFLGKSGPALYHTTVSAQIGAIFLFGIVGTTWFVFQNGVQLAYGSEGTYPSGTAALYISGSGAASAQLINFAGGGAAFISDNIIGFTPNYYFNQQSVGLSIWVSAGTINGVSYNGQVVNVPANATTQVSLNSNGQIVLGGGSNLYPIAVVVSGAVQTSGTPNTLPIFSPGILSITDVRPSGFSFP